MLISIIYYLQIDKQSERTNQIIEITLRYHLTANLDNDFITPLPYIQVTLNNSLNLIINVSLNKIIYRFKINNALQLLVNLLIKEYSLLRIIRREKTKLSIAQANAIAKYYYDINISLLPSIPAKTSFLNFIIGTLYPIQLIKNYYNNVPGLLKYSLKQNNQRIDLSFYQL